MLRVQQGTVRRTPRTSHESTLLPRTGIFCTRKHWTHLYHSPWQRSNNVPVVRTAAFDAWNCLAPATWKKHIKRACEPGEHAAPTSLPTTKFRLSLCPPTVANMPDIRKSSFFPHKPVLTEKNLPDQAGKVGYVPALSSPLLIGDTRSSS